MEYKHIAVKPETKAKFDRLCQVKDMSKDQLLKYLMAKV